MEDNQPQPTAQPESIPGSTAEQPENKSAIILGVIVGIVVLGLIIAGCVFLFSANLETTSRIRDIFIIFMALEFLLVGIALIILMVQMATLINLLQNEIKPILQSTQETADTLRGTTTFLSNNLVEPVIKLNSYLAGLKKGIDILNFTRK